MCTNIDRDASEKLYDKIKEKGVGYAWKLVQVNNDGTYYSPFQRYYYLMKKENRVYFKHWSDANRISISDGAFHLFTTRERGRKVIKWLTKDTVGNLYSRYNVQYKVIKVAFKVDDLIAVGHVDSGFKKDWNFDSNPDSICVRGFKFAN